jgi:hypothetical protein
MSSISRVPRSLSALAAVVLALLLAAAGFAVIIGVQNFSRIGV